MHIQLIKQIANEDQKLYKSLIHGYLRSCTDKELFDLTLQYSYEPKLGYWIFRSFTKQPNSEYEHQLAEHFLNELTEIADYKKSIAIARYLNYLYDHISIELQEKIATKFLTSKKKPLRMYACRKNLCLLPNNMLLKAFSILEDKHDEIRTLIDTINRENLDDFIQSNFNRLILQNGIKEYQIRKLFSKNKSIQTEHLKWLEYNYPATALYIAFTHARNLTDDEALQLSKNALKTINLDSHEGENLYSYIFWCLARLRKWDVLKKLIINRNNTHD